MSTEANQGAEVARTTLIAGLASIAGEGLAILDEERRFTFLNPAGARILAVDPAQILGQTALVFDPVTPWPDGDADRPALTHVPAAGGARTIEHAEERGDGHTLVVFRDTTERRRREGQLTGFAQTATAMAEVQRLEDVLDDVAAAVLEATGTAACTVVLYDAATQSFEQVGTAGGYPADYMERLDGCRRRGAPLASLEAYRTGRPQLKDDWARRVLSDPRWAPMHSVIDGRDWGSLSAVPLVGHDGVIGALTVFYGSGQAPAESDLAFLTSITALVAVAVRNHRLRAELKAKAALEERNRLARELHDSVSQALFSLNLRSQALRLANENPSAGRRDRVRAGLDDIQELTAHVLTEMRALITQLRPNELKDDGIVSAIRRHAEAVSARNGIAITVDGDPAAHALSGDAEVEVFRIVQEALTNVIRHANAQRVQITIGARDDSEMLEVVVEDDGEGFVLTRPRPGHIGLRSMQERCEGLGGGLVVLSRPGSTRVCASIRPDLGLTRPTHPRSRGAS